MTSKDMTEQGVAALKEGDSTRAHDLLQQAVELDPENAKAWFFLSKTQTSSADKRASLEKVLAIMPNNKPAQEALEKLDSASEDFSDFEEPAMSGASTSSSRSTSSSGAGFKLPVDIPGAPEKVDPKNVIEEFVQTFKNGIEILKRTEGVYPMEIQRASWWRFWQYVVVSWIIGSIASTISSIVSYGQTVAWTNEVAVAFGQEPVATSPGIFTIILTVILGVPIGAAVLYAGIYASHRWVTTSRAGQGSLVAHAYTIMLPSVTASIIGSVVGMVLIFVPLIGLLAAIFAFFLSIYALYIAAGGISMVHKVDKNTGYWTVAVMIVAQFITAFVITLVLSPFILTSAMAFI